MMKSKIKCTRHMAATAIVWAASLLILGGGYLLFYGPQRVNLQQITKRCTDSRTELQEAQVAAQDTTRDRQQKECEDVKALIENFSIHQEAATETVFDIGRIANELNLQDFATKNQKQKNYSTVGQSKRVSEVWLSVDFQSTFEQFAQFLNRLECHSPAVFVEEIRFQRGTEDAAEHKVSVTLSFLTHTGADNQSVVSAAH